MEDKNRASDQASNQALLDQEVLNKLARQALGTNYGRITPMEGGGSHRRFYRMAGPLASGVASESPALPPSLVGVAGEDRDEMKAFIAYTHHFAGKGIPVPRLFAETPDAGAYLLEDLGDEHLAERLRSWRASGYGTLALNALNQVVGWLARIQVRGGQGLDFSLAADGASGNGHTPPELDGRVFRADLEGFITHYALRYGPDGGRVPEAVQADLTQLVGRLEALSREHFCYRDFQARNIMWRKSTDCSEGPVFLDYQSGRKGPLAYDLASLLFSPDTGADEVERDLLIQAYLKALADLGAPQDEQRFLDGFYPIVLVRRLQALGAYARIGHSQGKPEYLEKIPPALATLGELRSQGRLNLGLPALEAYLDAMLAG